MTLLAVITSTVGDQGVGDSKSLLLSKTALVKQPRMSLECRHVLLYVEVVPLTGTRPCQVLLSDTTR